MSRSKLIIIIVAVVLLLLAVLASTSEYRDVSTNVWKETFSFNDEQPQGLYIFKEITSRFFKDVPMTKMGYPEDTVNINSLYIQFVPESLADEEVDTLLSIASKGNDVLIISNFLNNRIADTIVNFYDDRFVHDSSLVFNFTDPTIALDSNYNYLFQNREFVPNQPTDFYLMEGLDWESDLNYVKVATPDSLILLSAFPIGEGRLFYHVKTDLFYNYSYRQPQMFDYTQKILAHFDPQHIYLLSPLTIYSSGGPNDKNPLEYIMSQPALKAAYYLLMLGTLLFVFFGGKRKQKVIPVTEKNENTSLEYIETVSQLFYQQAQHEKLVNHMRNIFHHKMQKKFFVSPDDPNYVTVLAKKSKISETEIQYVMDRFKNLDDHFGFRGDQLVSLNRRLENIYKEIEQK